MSTPAAQELAKDLTGVDTLVVAHDGQSRILSSQPPLYGLGQKGREVVQLALDLGKGPIQDPLGLVDHQDQAAVLDNTIRTLEHRLAKATGDVKASGEAQLAELRKKRDRAVAEAAKPIEGRQAHQLLITLGSNVADDPQWAKRVAEETARDGRTPGH
jgi:hypothetical protein